MPFGSNTSGLVVLVAASVLGCTDNEDRSEVKHSEKHKHNLRIRRALSLISLVCKIFIRRLLEIDAQIENRAGWPI
jgi:hypothetical protein